MTHFDLEVLWAKPEEMPANDYQRDQILEQYKLYVEMADRIANRRHTTNSFFLTINTALIGIVGFVHNASVNSGDGGFNWPITLAGIALNLLWFEIIKSYKNIAGIKWDLIAVIERRLSVRPYAAEWIAAGKGRNAKNYRPFTHIELWIPWLFVTLHVFMLGEAIPWQHLMWSIGRMLARA